LAPDPVLHHLVELEAQLRRGRKKRS
jgi:hypothetical protein